MPVPGEVEEAQNELGGVITLPNLGIELVENDCETMKAKMLDPVLKGKLDSIKARATIDSHETGMVRTKASNGVVTYKFFQGDTQPGADGVRRLITENTNSDTDDAHNHVEDDIPIFSYTDLVKFYINYKFLHHSRRKGYGFYLPSHNGTLYALRMKDITFLDALFEGLNLDDPADLKKAERKIRDIYVDDGGMDTEQVYSAAMAEKMFMQVMNTSKMGNGNAISVFQYESDQWKELTLNDDGTIHKEPCP